MPVSKASEEVVSPLLYGLLFLSFGLLMIFNPWGDDVFLLPKWSFFLLAGFLYLCLLSARQIFEEKLPVISPSLAASLGLFLFSTTCSTWLSLHPPSSARFLGKVTAGACLAWVVACLSPERKRKLLYGYAIFSVFVAFYALLQKSGYDFVLWSDPSVFHRPASSSGNPVFMGAALAPSVILFWSWATDSTGIWKLPPLLSCALTLLAVVLSYSRGAYLALLIGSLIFLLMGSERKKKFVSFVAMIFLSAAPLYILAHRPVSISGQGKVTPLSRIQKPAVSNRIRIVLWRDAAKLLLQQPLFGWGAGAFSLFYPKERGVEILRWQNITALPEDAHNLLFQLGATQGFLGIFSIVLLITRFLFAAKNLSQKDLGLSVMASCLVPVLFQPFSPELFLLFFVLLGLPASAKTVRFTLRRRHKLEFLLIEIMIMIYFLPGVVRPLLSDIIFKQAMVSKTKRNYEEAIFKLLHAIDMDPENLKPRRELARSYREAYAGKKDPAFLNEAVRLYQELIHQMPLDASLYAELGLTYSQDARDPRHRQLAIKYYQKALQLDPKFALFHNDLGILYLNTKAYEKARRSFYRAVQLVPNFYEPYKNLSVLFHRKGKDHIALRYAQQALKYEQNDPELFAQTALLLDRNGMKTQALTFARKAYALKPLKKYKQLLSQLAQ